VPLPRKSRDRSTANCAGIRPENVHIARPGDTDDRGRVYLVENLGMHYLISVQIQNSHSEPITVRALLPTDQSWSNEEITLALPPKISTGLISRLVMPLSDRHWNTTAPL